VREVLLTRLVAAYEGARDPAAATAMAAYMRDQFAFLGLANPVRTVLDREIQAGLPAPSEADLAAVARACWSRDEREYQYFAVRYVRRHVRRAGPGFLPVLEELITTKSWWDTVDDLAKHAVGVLVRSHPELVAVMDEWIGRDNIWLARTAILHQLGAKEDTDLERLFSYCRLRAADKEFFIRKAIGWALREHTKTDPAAIRAFLEEMGDALSPLSRREALKWLERRAAPAR
jgi:3-methyladenine DNA glycosylase AlkD